MFALKDLMTRARQPRISTARQDGAALDPAAGRASYLFNATIAGIEQADALLIVGANPRREAAVLNARIRKRWRAGKFPIALIGERADLTYTYDYLGAGPETLAELAAGKQRIRRDAQEGRAAADHPRRRRAGAAGRRGGCRAGRQGRGRARRGQGRLERLLASCTPRPRASARSTSASCRARAGSTPAHMAKAGALDVLFLLGADEIDVPPGAFVVYIGTHGDAGAHRADVILPGAAYTEKSGIYVNTEGRVQMANRASFPPGEAREDWAILRALSDVLGKKLPYDSLAAACARRCSRRIRICSASTRSRRATPPTCAQLAGDRRHARQGAVPLGDRRLLSHQSDRARVRGDGRMLGARREPHHDGGGVGRWRNSGPSTSGR